MKRRSRATSAGEEPPVLARALDDQQDAQTRRAVETLHYLMSRLDPTWSHTNLEAGDTGGEKGPFERFPPGFSTNRQPGLSRHLRPSGPHDTTSCWLAS
jgi:hypothetical protein